MLPVDGIAAALGVLGLVLLGRRIARRQLEAAIRDRVQGSWR